MRVFVSEFIAGGALSGLETPPSMQREALAMLRSVTTDIARMPGYSVVTTLESGLSPMMDCDVIPINRAADETAIFQELVAGADAVLVIAPETGGILAERCLRVIEAGVDSWNCSPKAIELCGDKLELASHLQTHGLPTIPTNSADFAKLPDAKSWPIVLKPRDGAGSNLTFLVRDAVEWHEAQRQIQEKGGASNCLIQPYVEGRALSIGLNISLDGERIECLPVGEQRLSNDGRFHYFGGVIPADIPAASKNAIEELARTVCATIPGLAGYIGIDLLLTPRGEPLIVEINPRLTTAYVGYRQLYVDAIPQRWLRSKDSAGFITLRPGIVEFNLAEMLNSI